MLPQVTRSLSAIIGKFTALKFLLTSLILTTTLWIVTYNVQQQKVFEKIDLRHDVIRTTDDVKVACVRPELILNHPAMAGMFPKLDRFRCDAVGSDWVYVKNGSFTIDQSAVEKYGHVSCNYTPVERIDDFKVAEGQTIYDIKSGSIINDDFFEVKCSSENGITYRNLHIGIAHRSSIHRRPVQLTDDSLGLNVLMFGFDSVSRLTWMRQLPKTYQYLVDKLGAVVLEGYNIVGDGTPAALLPILTGKTEPELPEARRGHSGAKPVDGHPWIWRDLQNRGYVTQFGEDMSNINTFTYRMLGFKEQPTDHYLQPFYLKLKDFPNRDKRQKTPCFGSYVRLELALKYIRDLYESYPNRPKFSFVFNNEYSHDAIEPLVRVDELTKDWLVSLDRGGHLENTFLILMSDHGARYSRLREIVQGKFEERNPFFSIRPPPWFAKKYPEAMENLRINANRLSTPFDIHATFHDLIHFQNRKVGDVTKRGISLLQEIPKNRTCKLADIEPHWCSCLNWKNIESRDPRVRKAAQALLHVINSMTSQSRDKCEKLEIVKIVRSVMYSPKEQVLKFKKSADTDGRVADLSDNTKNDVILYQVSIHTTPGGGHFEATVKFKIKNGLYEVKKQEISRTNKYGDDPSCVMSKYPHLRPYCHCRK